MKINFIIYLLFNKFIYTIYDKKQTQKIFLFLNDTLFIFNNKRELFLTKYSGIRNFQ